MFSIFSKDIDEVAELFVIVVIVFVADMKFKGSDFVRAEVKDFKHIRYFSAKSDSNDEGYTFYFDGPLRDFFFDIIDRRKIDGRINLMVTGEDRYYGFELFCDLLTGVVTVDTRDSTFVNIDGKKATRKARKLCRVFARKYTNAVQGGITDWKQVLNQRM